MIKLSGRLIVIMCCKNKIKNFIRKLRILYIRGRIINVPEMKVYGHALVIAPHPDDEVFGCAGLISRLVRMGHKVDVIIMSGGGASHNTCCPEGVSDLIEKRRQLTLNAMKVLGLSHEKIYFLDYPDGEIDYAIEKIPAVIEKLASFSPFQDELEELRKQKMLEDVNKFNLSDNSFKTI